MFTGTGPDPVASFHKVLKMGRVMMLGQIGRMSAGVVRVAAASTLGLVDAAGSLAVPLLELASAGVARVGTAPSAVTAGIAGAMADLADAGLHRSKRRVWSHQGRAHIEVRGLTGKGRGHNRLANGVTDALKELKGVHWAEVNAVTQHVLIAFDEDAVDMDLLIECIKSVEEEHGMAEETFSRAEPEHPSADAPVTMAVITLAADVAGLGVALASRALRAPAVPRSIRIPLLFAENYPRFRHTVEGRLGKTHTELLFSVSSSALYAVSQGPTPIAIDGLHHFLKLAEVRSRQAVWHRRERELVGDGHLLPGETGERQPRPVPFPQGPVERLGDRTSLASLLGAGGMLALTRDPGRAAELMLATMPKTARQGREAFASVLGWELARRGVVPMDATALRRLDRISAVVIESSVLCTMTPRVLSAVAVGTRLDDRRVWQIAEGLLADGSRSDGSRSDFGSQRDASGSDRSTSAALGLGGAGPWTHDEWRLERAADAVPGDVGSPVALTLDVLDADGRHVGRVRIGCEADPLADALLVAARAAADRIVLTEHDSVSDLLPWADEVVPSGETVAHHIRALQADGCGVLLISGNHDAALHASDVGVTVVRPGEPVCWSADLLCGPGLDEAWWLLHAVRRARQVSERSTRLALGGSALGALLATTGSRQSAGRPGGLAPVHSASLVAVTGGAYTAYRLGRLAAPRPTVRGNWHDLSAQEAFARTQTVRQAEAVVEPLGQFAALSHVAREMLRSTAGLPVIAQTIVAPARGVAALSGAVAEELRDPLTPVLAFGAAASAVVGSGVDALLVGGVMAGNAVISGGQRLRAERALRGLLIGELVDAHRVDWVPPTVGAVGAVGGEPVGDFTAGLGDGSSDSAAIVWFDSPAEAQAAKLRAAAPPTSTAFHGAFDEASDEAWLAGLLEAPVQTVPAEALRVGDVVRLAATDVVPADLRLLAAAGLEADESSLTGESMPVAKAAYATPGADLADRTCMLYEGCTVLVGIGYAVVVAVGQATEAGRAAAVAGSAPPPAGIQARLAELTRIALPVAGLGGVAVTGIAALRGVPMRQAVASGVAIAVAAVPEGLPLVATVAQLAAARRLSRHGVLVRSSRTLEALGRVDTLCFDKTGTLTQGRLALAGLADPGGDLAADGPEGAHLLRFAARACPRPGTDGSTKHLAHATDRAVVEAALAHTAPDTAWNLVAELPFETNRGYAASLGTNTSRLTLAVKGAPEIVLEACTSVAGRTGSAPLPLTGARRQAALGTIARLAGKGLRVLAVAEAHPDADTSDPAAVDVASLVAGLTLVGFVAIADTPRATAAAAIARLAGAGVRITMITGDHPSTATAVAAQLGIADADRVLTGAEMDKLPKRERIARVASTTVFARMSPEQKVRIVQALQQAGKVVAMTGDGSNDAAAIRLADVGIAMAGHGSASARTAADLVLAEPDPARIADALVEGRALWGNVRDAASILVGGNAGEVAFTVLGTAVSGKAPLGTRQLLLVNMLTDMLPALAVALAPARPTADGADPLASGPVAALWGPELARNLAVRGGATALGATMAWGCGRMTGRQRRASTMGLGALIGTQLGQTLVTGRHSPLVIATSVVSAAALFAVVETPGVSQFFGCTPLGPVAWSIVAWSSAGATATAVLAPSVLARFGGGGGGEASAASTA